MAEPKNNNPYDQLMQEAPEELHPVLQYITDHIKLFAIGIGAILVIVGAYAGFTAYQNSQIGKAQDELGAILIIQDPAEKIEKLNGFLTNAPGDLGISVRLALAKTLMEQKDYQKAAEIWSKLKDENEEFRFVAWLGQTKCLLLADKPEAALSELSQMKSKAPHEYNLMITRQSGEAAEALGQYAEAIRNYQELAPQSPPQDRAYLEARIKTLEDKL
jgi:predicted negative regulator of RcsB-dependent stress response